MAEIDFTLTAAPMLGGEDVTVGANHIAERSDLALVSVATPQGGEEALAEALRSSLGLAVPEQTVSSTAKDHRAIRTALDQMMLVFPHRGPDANAAVQERLGGTGYTTDQTDVWVVLEISGPDTLPALERLCPLDTATMPVDGSARTMMAHMGAMIVRLAEDRFLLFSARSSAKSFLHAIETSYHNVGT